MKAVSMSISIPVKEACNKNCPYCISKMTEPVAIDKDMWKRNLTKARALAERSFISSVILTGKHDPLQNMSLVLEACEHFKTFPLEIQTNGILLNKAILLELYHAGIDTIAISVDSMLQLSKLTKTLELIDMLGLTSRLTFNITDMLTAKYVKQYPHDWANNLFADIEEFCIYNNVQQVSFRTITAPKYAVENVNSCMYELICPEGIRAMHWIDKHASNLNSSIFNETVRGIIDQQGEIICNLPFGAHISMLNNISYTYFDYCIQDKSGEDDIRSLIYFDDGHMSRSWNGSNFGRIF